jgi:hypothetical protein
MSRGIGWQDVERIVSSVRINVSAQNENKDDLYFGYFLLLSVRVKRAGKVYYVCAYHRIFVDFVDGWMSVCLNRLSHSCNILCDNYANDRSLD